MAARLVTVARDTLKSFKVDGFRIYKNDVACSSKVGRALRLCANLETANIPIWDQVRRYLGVAKCNLLQGSSRNLRPLSCDFRGCKMTSDSAEWRFDSRASALTL